MTHGPTGVLSDQPHADFEGFAAAGALVGGDADLLQQLDKAGFPGECLLGAFALGDVAQDAGEELSLALRPVGKRELDRELRAVLALGVDLHEPVPMTRGSPVSRKRPMPRSWASR